MSKYETISLEKRGKVAILTINRPDKLNALNKSVHAEGVAALDALRADDSVRVLVITGSGGKSFIAGADITEFEGQTPVTQRDLFHEKTFFNSIDTFPKPVIAMVNGFCLGGGNELALACDLRICSENARFSQPEINLGTIPGAGGTQRLTRAIGKAKAMDLVLTGRLMDAAEAERSGLVARVVPAAELLAEAIRLAETIATKSQPIVAMAKDMVNAAFEASLEEGIRIERRSFYATFATEDRREGMAAFVEKRAPGFRQR